MLAIAMIKHLVFHARSKHTELRHHFIRDMDSKKEIQLKFIITNDHTVDILQKVVLVKKFQQFKEFLKNTN